MGINFGEKLDVRRSTCTGNPWKKGIAGAPVYNDDVIRGPVEPVYKEGSLAVLKGNPLPNGAVIKACGL